METAERRQLWDSTPAKRAKLEYETSSEDVEEIFGFVGIANTGYNEQIICALKYL